VLIIWYVCKEMTDWAPEGGVSRHCNTSERNLGCYLVVTV